VRLRFTIRDLLWLTVVVALAVGWWLDHHNQSERYATLEQSATAVKSRELQGKYQALTEQLRWQEKKQDMIDSENSMQYLPQRPK
jgi:hypothetical protein